MAKFGYQTYGWYHYREQNDADVSLRQILREIADAGFTDVELCSPTEELGDAASLKALLGSHGLTLRALTGRIDGGLIGWTKERIDLLHELGGEVMVVNAGWIQPGEEKTERRYQQLAEGLEELAEYGLPRGVQVAYHNHLGTICETPDEIARLFGMVEKARYCLDTGHLAAAGGSVPDVIEQHADRIAYVHLKDTFVEPVSGEFREFVRLGDGNAGVDVPQVVAALESHGYGGWFMVEQDHTHTTPGDDARANAEYLRRLGLF